MGLKEMLAARKWKKFRFAVLRPRNKFLIPTDDQFKSFVGMDSSNFQAAMSDTLRDGAILVGYLKRGSMTLYDEHGKPCGQLERGDVLDTIEDFRKAVETGAYTKAEIA